MKLCVRTAATAFALSSPALAQTGTSDGLNGATLGKSMPGANRIPAPQRPRLAAAVAQSNTQLIGSRHRAKGDL
jgi:hypothetical protein